MFNIISALCSSMFGSLALYFHPSQSLPSVCLWPLFAAAPTLNVAAGMVGEGRRSGDGVRGLHIVQCCIGGCITLLQDIVFVRWSFVNISTTTFRRDASMYNVVCLHEKVKERLTLSKLQQG